MKMPLNPILPRFSYQALLISLVFFFIVAPFFSKGDYALFMLDLSILVILIMAVYICSDRMRNVVIAVVLASPGVVRMFHPSLQIDEVTLLFNAMFFAFVIYELLIKIFRTRDVTGDLIFAAIAVYMLIGFFWGLVYTLLEVIWAGSFTITPGLDTHGFYSNFSQDLIYYSFVSLATLGYGDITAISKPAQFLSVLEAMIGQIYLTVLVARLVGMHIATVSQQK